MTTKSKAGGGNPAIAEANHELKLVDAKKAAEILGMPSNTLAYLRAMKRGPRWIKLEGRIKYDVNDLRAYVDAGRSADTSVRAEAGD